MAASAVQQKPSIASNSHSDSTTVTTDESSMKSATTKRKKRTIDFIVENEEKSEMKTPGIQRWLQQKELMEKIHHDLHFKSLSQNKRLKKEMTESSSQMKMIDWLCDKYGAQITRNEGEDICIVDICSGKGFFGVLASHLLPRAQIICCDKNKKMNIKHFDSCSNVSFHFVDILAHKFSLSEWIRNEFEKYNKRRLILFGTHLCGILSQVIIDAFNELEDVAFALFLVPCCFPKSKHSIVAKAKEMKMENMDYWIEYGLLNHVKRQDNDGLLVECIEMEQMLSEKNRAIRIIREKMTLIPNNDLFGLLSEELSEHSDLSEPPLKKQRVLET